MARVKFRSQAENLLSVKEFPEIIRELYRSTPSSDRGLRDIVSHIRAQQGRTVVDRPDLYASIVENGEFGLDILREALAIRRRQSREGNHDECFITAESDEEGGASSRYMDFTDKSSK